MSRGLPGWRWVYWPVCALFGHEAMGLLSSSLRRYDTDTFFCACGRHEMTGSYVASRMSPRVPRR